MKIHYLVIGLLCLTMPIWFGCSEEEAPSLPKETHPLEVKFSIASVGTGAISRASSPTHEVGSNNENAIDNAIIILYDKPLNSNDANAEAGRVLKVISLTLDDKTTSSHPQLDLKWYDNGGNAQSVGYTNRYVERYYAAEGPADIADQIEALGAGNTIYAIALANIALTDLPSFDGMSVKQLREMAYNGPLFSGPSVPTTSNPLSSCTKFAMSGINEVKFVVPGEGEETLEIPTFMVQRLAACVEMSFGNVATTYTWNGTDPFSFDQVFGEDYDAGALNGKYRFPIYDEDVYVAKKTDAVIPNVYFELQDISLINCVNSGCYLFEHSSGTPAYIGNEGSWSSGLPANFIQSLDSRTIADRQLTGASLTPVQLYTGTQRFKNTNHTYDSSDVFSITSILGYVGENTFSAAQETAFTGIRLAGVSNIKTIEDDTLGETSEMQVSIALRHSFGNVGSSTNPLIHGVVRNTIYRVYVKFYASKEHIVVRWYYYDGSDTAFKDHAYTATFDRYIHENPYGPTDD